VLMFFNLCMACLHLLPLPGQLVGECLMKSPSGHVISRYCKPRHTWLVLTVLAASPLLDYMLGRTIVYQVYESMSSLAIHVF